MKIKVGDKVKFSEKLKKKYILGDIKYIVSEIRFAENYCLICKKHHQKSIICKQINKDETVWFTECEIRPSLKELINKILKL